jgi:hypothetical protein
MLRNVVRTCIPIKDFVKYCINDCIHVNFASEANLDLITQRLK